MTLFRTKTTVGALALVSATALSASLGATGPASAGNIADGNISPYAHEVGATAAIVPGGGNTLAANPEQRAPDLTIVVLMPEGMPATGLADDPYAEPADQLAAVAFDGKNGADDLSGPTVGGDTFTAPPAETMVFAEATMVGKIAGVDGTGHTIALENGDTYQLAGNVPIDAIEVHRDVALTFNVIGDQLQVTNVRRIAD